MLVNRWTRATILLTGLTGVGLAIIAIDPSSPRPGVTKQNFDRVEKGMTRTEVKAILGQFPQADIPDMGGAHRWASWQSDDGAASVDIGFFQDKVIDKLWSESSETFPERIRRWLHLR